MVSLLLPIARWLLSFGLSMGSFSAERIGCASKGRQLQQDADIMEGFGFLKF
jgi:hypothetical protein